MPPVTRAKVDQNSGHVSFPPSKANTGSPNVFVNGNGAMRQGDPFLPHASPSPSPPHIPTEKTGSGTVFVNGKPINRIGDPVSCGGVNASGSSNVFAGG